METNVFFQFEIIINVLVISFRLIWIPKYVLVKYVLVKIINRPGWLLWDMSNIVQASITEHCFLQISKNHT